MTKIEIIDEIVLKKNNELAKSCKKFKSIELDRSDAYFEVIQQFFGGIFSIEDVYFEKSSYGSSWTVKRPNPDYNYDKEVMSIRFKEDWKTNEYTDIETSIYSTSENSVWELERLISIGEVAKVVVDFSDDIIAAMNSVTEKFSKLYKKAYDVKRTIEVDISKLRDEKNSSYLSIAEDLIETKGLKFDDKKGAIDLRWDWTLRGISSAKIINKTASGKSADIEIGTYGETPRVFEKVRMSNVNDLFWQYRDYVLTAEKK